MALFPVVDWELFKVCWLVSLGGSSTNGKKSLISQCSWKTILVTSIFCFSLGTDRWIAHLGLKLFIAIRGDVVLSCLRIALPEAEYCHGSRSQLRITDSFFHVTGPMTLCSFGRMTHLGPEHGIARVVSVQLVGCLRLKRSVMVRVTWYQVSESGITHIARSREQLI